VADSRPLVVHVVYRFATGGLENGIVNLVDRMPREAYRHAILALTEVEASFAARISRCDIALFALHKPPGHGFWLYPRVVRLLRELQPSIVHTRNLAALEMSIPAWLAGVPVRVHGEHGRDVEDPDGALRRYQWVRRIYAPFVDHYIALSMDLAAYLTEQIGIDRHRVSQIYNGVLTDKFAPRGLRREEIAGLPFRSPTHWLIGTVGRMQTVKNQTLLAEAFVLVLRRWPALRERLRLVMVGEGSLRERCQQIVAEANLADLCWIPGARDDVAAIMRSLDCFVLPSLAEGISNTILEAMASGLPVIATDVGGNGELVDAGVTGLLVPSGNAAALADSMARLALDPALALRYGETGRAKVQSRFDIAAMVSSYQALYDRLLRRGRRGEAKQ
jgi:sugar transferase (PEP-CTERM/EpsH1 system associated)